MTWRTLTYGGALVLTLAAFATWRATGGEGYTRWPDEKLAQSDRATTTEEDDLLAEIGFDVPDAPETAPSIESRFALGLVPGGFDPPHLLSVASITALAALAAVVALAGTIRARRGRAATPMSTPPMEHA